MTDPKFDWTTILPEPDMTKVRADLEAKNGKFLESFPTREELEEAGREGRAALKRAVTIVDNRNKTEQLLNAAIDHIAGTLEQPTDQRAWDHLLIYCPREALERRLDRLNQQLKEPT